ncbi:hypothetical protein M3Y98_00538600 [Aphelenchoides besseyi]|nr:hypothetical protein M3Y98_00538600 [Aphelenchoides besseyi]KAI6208112.1 hypothetical protein M3Y96_00080300 [Aphelenchoides besseyi]
MNINRSTDFSVAITVFVLIKFVVLFANGLECIQCDRRGTWYSPEDSERHVVRCQNGMIEPTRCLNSSHTHCIYSFYRQGASSNVIVTERRCGVQEDILGCTLYKSSKRRFRRHFFGGASTPSHSTTNSHTRRDAALFVEVCTEGCEEDGCVNSSPSIIPTFLSMLLVGICILLNY